jgi:hypothetical protein
VTGRYFVPTSGHSKSYIGSLWNARHELAESERRGFAQFFYLMLSSHLESSLSKIIELRIDSAMSFNPNSILVCPSMHGSIENEPVSCSSQPIYESLLNILSEFKSEVEVAPLNKLVALYKKTFGKGLKEVIGKDLNSDLSALGDLRNILAHGRDLYLETRKNGVADQMLEVATLDGNPLQNPIKRLMNAGIITMSISAVDGMNWHEFLSILYCDSSLLYFYDAVKKIDIELKRSIENPFESYNFRIIPLPNLDD